MFNAVYTYYCLAILVYLPGKYFIPKTVYGYIIAGIFLSAVAMVVYSFYYKRKQGQSLTYEEKKSCRGLVMDSAIVGLFSLNGIVDTFWENAPFHSLFFFISFFALLVIICMKIYYSFSKKNKPKESPEESPEEMPKESPAESKEVPVCKEN